ncbi:MAG: 2-oxoglutarate dehydrogenase E1 component, partial [Leptospiraceae bacterium]|nr:2-oxoglutarate dehydrogenase E1 component [Leptospiraceae bacterium]
TLRNIIQHMEKVYCDSIGAEFFYIRDESRRNWIIEHLENERHLDAPRKAVQRMLFDKLWSAESLEKFIARRYPGKKRFSLEGGESLIPTLASVVENAGSYEIRQIVIGMAHRGRVNVLKNVMGKDIMQIFAEFDENIDAEEVAGDVKYHMGYSSDVAALTGENVHLSLAFNPSHLEVINPVVLGSVRARQTRGNDKERTRYLPVIIHGDAAFAGQGINYECLNMSGLEGYRVGGALHIIVNNQIGFTTLPEEGRSTPYCTDLAKMLQAPIFHVNGDDPEACYRAVQLCLEWRQVFRTDIFLDLICYRRWGHNETDEPAFTQPVMYDRIKKHSSTVTLYEERLKSDNFDQAELDEIKQSRNQELETAFERIKNEQHKIERETLAGQWSGFKRANALSEPDTTISPDRLEHITRHVTTVPDNFPAHRKIERLLQQRVQMVSEDRIDWGMAESLCYGALLLEGVSVRISGQDARRGTFSHRHAAIYNLENQKPYIPLAHLNPSRARFEIMNSLLSEVAVLGFEFGYSLADPRTLVIWEAQFGDFANGAQVIIDQFISSCEAKWNRMSGIVLLLPHGYEGQGPEHSSARLERFLQLCSQNNIQVCNPTTPAQYFHLIRRQMKRDYRKPLIIMSPKSLLRMPMATSATAEFTDGQFQDVLDDPTADPDG